MIGRGYKPFNRVKICEKIKDWISSNIYYIVIAALLIIIAFSLLGWYQQRKENKDLQLRLDAILQTHNNTSKALQELLIIQFGNLKTKLEENNAKSKENMKAIENTNKAIFSLLGEMGKENNEFIEKLKDIAKLLNIDLGG